VMVNEHCLRKNSVSRVIDVSVVEAADDPFLGSARQAAGEQSEQSSPKEFPQVNHTKMPGSARHYQTLMS
jgi:hypothetical protein